MDELERRVMELELRSEERREEVERLQGFVAGYEKRIAELEKRVELLIAAARNEPDELVPHERPPHY